MATGRRERSCPICCEVPADIAYALPCRHQFCLGCILRWLRGNCTCPLCRRLISTVSFSEREEDCLQCIIRQRGRAGSRARGAPGGRDGSGTPGPGAPPAAAQQRARSPAQQRTRSPAQQGAAGPAAVGGILPELWAELFRRRWKLLDPVRSWLQQWLQQIYRERWWQVKTAESSVLLALCIFGPDREVLEQRLRPRLQQHTALLVRGVLRIIETQCSREVRRLRRCGAAGEEPESPGVSPGPTASPGHAATAAESPRPGAEHEAGASEEEPRDSPGASEPVPAEPEQP